jgi:hypothetical protein
MRRKAACILFATAMTLTSGAVTAAPAAAAGGTKCINVFGTVKFKPVLPKRGSKTKVKPTVTIKAHVGQCSSGVSNGTLDATLKAGVAGNCNTLHNFVDMQLAGTAKIAWNNHTTSRIPAATMTPVPHSQMIRMKLTGKVAGKFAGATLTSELNFTTPVVGGCSKSGLSESNIRRAHPLTIE